MGRKLRLRFKSGCGKGSARPVSWLGVQEASKLAGKYVSRSLGR